jgi:hypothetical protein
MTQLAKAVSLALVLAIVACMASIARSQDDTQKDKDRAKLVRAQDVYTKLRASEELAIAQLAVERAALEVAELRAQLTALRAKYTRRSDIITATNKELAVAKANQNKAWGSLALLLGNGQHAEYKKAKTQFAALEAERARLALKAASRTTAGEKFHVEVTTGLRTPEKPPETAQRVRLELKQSKESSVAATQREILDMMREMRQEVREIRKLVESLRPRAANTAR